MELSIIILNYNTKDLTIDCLKSIENEYKQELEENKFEIILVDNASSDKSLSAFRSLKSESLNLKLIVSKENLGFSKGCNLAAEKAEGESLLFLNSDTVIKDKGLVKMAGYLKENKNIGILGGKLSNPDGSPQPSAGKFYNLFSLFLMLLGLERLGFLRESPLKIKKVDWVSGACLMINKELFGKIGGFEKELFMYMEDMELCFKAKINGFGTYFYPEVSIIHKERGSGNRTFAILNIYKGILFFYKKYKPGREYNIARQMLYAKAFLLKNIGNAINNKFLTSTYGQALELF